MNVVLIDPMPKPSRLRRRRLVIQTLVALALVGVGIVIGYSAAPSSSPSLSTVGVGGGSGVTPPPPTPQPSTAVPPSETPLNSTDTSNTTAATNSPRPPPASRPIFMVLGDSITQLGGDPATQGWSALLQLAYIRNVDVLNRGLWGFNTNQFITYALPVLSKELTTNFAPVLITLWLGANDAGPMDMSGVPIDQYRENLVFLLSQLRSLAPQANIVLLTPPVVDEARLPQLSNAQVGKYAAVCANVSQAIDGVALLDVYSYMVKTYPWPSDQAALLIDGLHLSAQGNRVVFDQLHQQIKLLLPSSLIDTPQIG